MPTSKAAGAAVIALLAAVSLEAVVNTADARSRGAKRDKVSEIIVHATGGPFCKDGRVVFSPAGTVATMKRFFEASGQVSIHYIVGRDGEVAKSIAEDEVAIHTIGHNDRSIGIELINAGDGREAYTTEQIDALAKLIRGIQQRWRIPVSEVKGHEDVDSSTFRCAGQSARRKQDPGPLFPWDRFKRDLASAEKPQRVPTRN